MKLGLTDKKAETPEFYLGDFVGMDQTGRNYDFQSMVKVGDKIVFAGVCRTIGIDDPNDELDVAEDGSGKLNNAKFIKAKSGALKGEYTYIVLKGFEPDVTGLGPQKK